MYSVLYVDDEEVLLELGKTFLEMSGSLQVATSLSAAEAIEYLKAGSVDCIISDYQMPEMDGIAFLKYVRANHGPLPFILFTGRGREEVVIEAFSHTADFYLQKGGDPTAQFVELEHKVRLAIERRRTRDELKESQQRMADIIDHLPDATFAIDLGHRVIAWNLAMEEMTGVKKEDILGSSDQSYALPFYGEKRPLLLDLILSDDSITAKKYPFITKKGSKLISEIYLQRLYGGKGAYLWFIASPLYDTDGSVIGAIESIRDVTDPHKAKDELMASQERYRAVVEDQTEFISRFLPDGTHVFVNEAYCRYFGKSPSEIIGTRFRPDIFPEDAEKIHAHLLSLSPDHPERMLEHRIVLPGGIIRWQQWSDRAIFDEQGTVREYQSVGRDITDQKRSEDELRRAYEELTAVEEEMRAQFEELKHREDEIRESERKYRSILEEMQDTYYRSDKEGNLLMLSPSGVRLLGYDSEDEMTGKAIAATFYYDAEQRNNFLAAITRDGIVTGMETILKRRDGSPVTVSTNSHKYFDKGGNFLGVEGTFRDISRQKRSDEALRDSEERYRSLFENTGTAMVLLEENTVISIPNAEFVRLTGYSLEEIEGKMRWTSLVVKKDLDRMLAQHRLRRERREEALRHYDFRLVTKNGDIRNIYLTIDVIPGTKQSVASLMDITDKVHAQESLKIANRKLNLLNNITRHDILNQLTSLFGFLELVNRNVTDPVLISYLEREKKAAESIRSHIEFTRDYQEVGIRAPEWQRVNEVIRTAGQSVSLKGITFAVEAADVEVYADLLLQKVFYTLIDNATRHGGQVTKIRFSSKESPASLLILCEDDGIGVPADAKEKIFQRRYYQNTGLGLFLSQEILSITGLTLTETGIPGKGARFEIHVPKGAFRHP
jgi:PAS domain S-box-containing protein